MSLHSLALLGGVLEARNRLSSPPLMGPPKPIEWPAVKKFDPRAFFKKRPGLCVNDAFAELVVSKARSGSFESGRGVYRDSSYDASGHGITSWSTHHFDESLTCVRLATMLKASNRAPRKAALARNHHCNLLRLPGIIAWACRDLDGWNVAATEDISGLWFLNTRVFDQTEEGQ